MNLPISYFYKSDILTVKISMRLIINTTTEHRRLIINIIIEHTERDGQKERTLNKRQVLLLSLKAKCQSFLSLNQAN